MWPFARMKRSGNVGPPAEGRSRRCSLRRRCPSRARIATHTKRERSGSAANVRCAAECLDYALRIREPHGIWGGLNETERRGLIEARAAG